MAIAGKDLHAAAGGGPLALQAEVADRFRRRIPKCHWLHARVRRIMIPLP